MKILKMCCVKLTETISQMEQLTRLEKKEKQGAPWEGMCLIR